MNLIQLIINLGGLIITTEKAPRTWDQICLEKLKEIGISTAAQWSAAMGYKQANALTKIIKRIKKDMPDKLKIYYKRKSRQYEAM